MKICDLYNAVAQLGFQDEIDEEKTFYPALNRALHTVLRLVQPKKRKILSHYPPTALVTESDKLLHGGGVLSYNAEGAKSFYIEISGKGIISFKNSNGSSLNNVTWDTPYGYRVIRHIMESDVTAVEISAETMCKLRCMALYGELTSTRTSDIPAPNHYVTYNLNDVFSDFFKLSEQPKILNYNGKVQTLQDYIIEGGLLSLPRGLEGDIEIIYIPSIPAYTSNDKNSELDVPDDCIGALTFLIASYVWLEDEEELAKEYKSRYDEEITLVVRARRELNITRYESVNNW